MWRHLREISSPIDGSLSVFLLVFHIHRLSNSCRLEVIIDFQLSKMKPEVEISLCDATQGINYMGTICRCGFLISVLYTALV
jgi:hypothetical protein